MIRGADFHETKIYRTPPLFYSRSQYRFASIAYRYAKQESGYFAALLSVSAARKRAINSSKLCAAASFKNRLFMSEFSMSGRARMIKFFLFFL